MKHLPVLAALLLSTAPLFAGELTKASVHTTITPIVAQAGYGDIARNVVKILERRHLSQKPFDDEMSKKAFRNLLDAIDYDRILLTDEDLKPFASRITQIDDELKAGNVSLGYELINIIRKKFNERYQFIQRSFDKPFDFTVDESYQWRRKEAKRPATRAEQERLWHLDLKNEMLAIKLGKQLDAEEALPADPKAKLTIEIDAAGIYSIGDKTFDIETLALIFAKIAKERPTQPVVILADKAAPLSTLPSLLKTCQDLGVNAITTSIKPADAQAAKVDPIQANEAAELAKTPQERILKRYRAARNAFAEMDSETVLQLYLTAASTAYDPHTNYLSPMTLEDFTMHMNLTLCGIGATLQYDDGLIKIVEVMDGGPAGRDMRKNRLVVGDRIIGVGQGDGPIENIMHKPLNRSIRKIRGPKGSKVILKVIPASDKSGLSTKTIDLVRDEIKLEEQAVSGHIKEFKLPNSGTRRFGYAKIPTFYASMGEPPTSSKFRSVTADLVKQIADFNAKRVDGMILDLRNNGGGSLIEAIQMTSLFVCGPVVRIKDAWRSQTLSAPRIDDSVAFRKPLIVLINRNSASASEIVAGALKDYGRAIIVGDSHTHGKGTVQDVTSLDGKNSGSEKITTASFYRINGSSTQLKGVSADIVIPSVFDAFNRGEDTLKDAFPWTEITPAFYEKISDMKPVITQLKPKSQARLLADKDFKEAQAMIAFIKKLEGETTITLEQNKRLITMKAERKIRKIQEDLLNDSRKKEEAKAKEAKHDFVLRESYMILNDYLNLNDKTRDPFETNGNLGNRLMNLIK